MEGGEVKLSDVEITLSAWAQAKWFRLLATGTRALILPVITAVGMLIWGLQGDVRDVRETQAIRAEASDDNFAALTSELQAVKTSQGDIASDVNAINLKLANMAGILEQMRNQRVGMILP